jgi:hypothetical protein
VSLTSGESGSIAREGIAGTDLYVLALDIECCNCVYFIEPLLTVKWSDARNPGNCLFLSDPPLGLASRRVIRDTPAYRCLLESASDR